MSGCKGPCVRPASGGCVRVPLGLAGSLARPPARPLPCEPALLLPPPPQLFIYMLFQASVRPMISKLLGWGMSPAMAAIKPSVPKPLQFDWFKDK